MEKDIKCSTLPEVAEPLDELSRIILVELYVREVDLEDGGAGVAHEEEHQFGLTQVHGGKGGGVKTVKAKQHEIVDS